MKRKTLITIAQQVGVSVATVSRALNNVPGVGEDKRRQIQAIASEINYHPNILAQDLQRQHISTIGYIIEGGDSQFAEPLPSEDLLIHLTHQCVHDDIDLLVYTGNNGLKQVISAFHSQRIRSVIIPTTYKNDSHINYFHKHNVQLVTFGYNYKKYKYPYVTLDEPKGIYMATKHLIEQGHHRIAFLETPSTLCSAMHRRDGYLSALEQNNILQNTDYIASNLISAIEVYGAIEYLLKQPKTPTAFVTTSDTVAIHTIKIARYHRLRAGYDYAIVGLGDTHLAQYTDPPLTSLRLPLNQISKHLINLATQPTDKSCNRQSIVLNLELVVRESS